LTFVETDFEKKKPLGII